MIRTFIAVAAAGLSASGAGCSRKEPADQAVNCARREGPKDLYEAQVCYYRLLKADPDYTDKHLRLMTALTRTEVEAVNNLCQIILDEYFGRNIALIVSSDVPFPIPGQGPVSRAPGAKEPKQTIALPGVIAFDYLWDDGQVEAAIVSKARDIAIVLGDKQYSIVKCRVMIEAAPSSFGQPVPGQYYHRVTIVPLKVADTPALRDTL